MPATIKFADGEHLLVEESPQQVLKAIQEATKIGELKMAEVNGAHTVYVNVDQIRSVSAP